MKNLVKILIVIFLFLSIDLFSQTYTFSATSPALLESGATVVFPVTTTNVWAAYRWIEVSIPVSGLPNLSVGGVELLQVNIDYGDASQSFFISTSTDVDIKSPANATLYEIIDGNGLETGINYKHVDIKLRDHATLNMPLNNHSNTNMEPYNVGFYRTNISDQFDTFNGENPNGTWTIRFDNESTRARPIISKVELIFGVKNEVDITAITSNNSCATPQEFCNEKAFIYYNDGFTNNPSQDPGFPFDGCQWNNGLDNIGWFAFTASETTARIEISGIDIGANTEQQVIVLGNSTGGMSCDENDLYSVSGGCPKDGVNQVSAVYSNGTKQNIDLNLSGLTIGEPYFLVVDGEGGNLSESYLTMTHGADDCNSIVLPITLTSFFGVNINNVNELTWQTASEENNDYFIIERSTDAIAWEEIGIVYGVGNSNIPQDYKFVDNDLKKEVYYYRLKQTDFDGTVTYFKIISVKSETKQTFSLSPNPVNNYININLDSDLKLDSKIIITDVAGKLVLQTSLDEQSKRIDLSNFTKGIYFIRIGDKTEKFFKQ